MYLSSGLARPRSDCGPPLALLLGCLWIFAPGADAQVPQPSQTPPAIWNGEIGVGASIHDGDRAWAVEGGALRHVSGNRSLAIGARLLFAPESGVCVALGPCPDGPMRLVAIGAQLEPRFHLGAPEGATPASSWLAPRMALALGDGALRNPLLELGGALGHEVRLGTSAGIAFSARFGVAAIRSRGGTRTAPVVGLTTGLRWEL
jgi:hypothetical protein